MSLYEIEAELAHLEKVKIDLRRENKAMIEKIGPEEFKDALSRIYFSKPIMKIVHCKILPVVSLAYFSAFEQAMKSASIFAIIHSVQNLF